MEKTVAAVGFCCADVYEKLNKFYPTGNGVDWGVHLARMGVPVSVVSVVGTDSYGEKMKEALAAEGIDISHLRTEPGDTCKWRATPCCTPTCSARCWTACPHGRPRACRW